MVLYEVVVYLKICHTKAALFTKGCCCSKFELSWKVRGWGLSTAKIETHVCEVENFGATSFYTGHISKQ